MSGEFLHGFCPDKGIKFLAGEFEAAGFPKEDIHAVEVEGGEAVLIVRYRGDGSSGKKPIRIFTRYLI